jgi:hypothetical protein
MCMNYWTGSSWVFGTWACSGGGGVYDGRDSGVYAYSACYSNASNQYNMWMDGVYTFCLTTW